MFVIPVKEGSPIALPPAEVGWASAFRARIVGVAAELENVQIHIGRPDNANGSAVACTALPGGEWRAYASPIYFPMPGKAKYRVTARTPEGDSVLLGTGSLTVAAAPVNTPGSETEIIPDDTYVRNPKTGLWHKLTITEEEDGDLTPHLEPKGIAR